MERREVRAATRTTRQGPAHDPAPAWAPCGAGVARHGRHAGQADVQGAERHVRSSTAEMIGPMPLTEVSTRRCLSSSSSDGRCAVPRRDLAPQVADVAGRGAPGVRVAQVLRALHGALAARHASPGVIHANTVVV